MNEEYLKVVTQLGRPIPGQGLTTDPDNPQPYEKPPQFTSVHEATEFIFGRLIEEETYIQTMNLLADDMPIMDIVQTLLFTGFTEGKWSPDLMLMLVEPVAYMLLALAERADIEPIIYRGEDEDEIEEERIFGTKYEKEKLERLKKFSLKTNPTVSEVISPEMAEQIEQLPTDVVDQAPQQNVESLLAPPVEEPIKEEEQ